MNEYIKLAWRNIWRNKRRTLITAASIFFAVIIAIVMRSFQIGSYDHMIHNVVETYTGYIQVQDKNYWGKKTINNTFVYNDSLPDVISRTKNIREVYPRLESFALASSGNVTKGAFVMGIVPEKEDHMTNASQRIVRYQVTEKITDQLIEEGSFSEKVIEQIRALNGESFTSEQDLEKVLYEENTIPTETADQIKQLASIEGTYLRSGENEVLVAEKLAQFLDIGVGDTLILISQGLHGISASGLFPVKGIIKLPNPELNRSFIYMPLSTAQSFYSAQNRLTSLAINLHDQEDKALMKTKEELQEKLDTQQFAVKDWKEMNPELVQQIQSDNASGKLMIGVLYLIIGFGIFSTVLMMTAERRREFGVMIAIGLKKLKLSGIVITELIFIGLLGLLSGMLASMPLVLLGYYNPIRLKGDLAASMESFGMEPIMPLAMIDTYYLNQAWVVIIIIMAVMIYPVVNILRLKEIDALRA
ncbi:MAG: ABC transporter permease [Bacteroidota bacterium]